MNQEMRQVLAELELISHGSITAYNSSGGAHNDPAAFPPGELFPPHLTYRKAFDRATSDPERQHIFNQARAELAAIRVQQGTPPPSKTDREILSENILDAKGWHEDQVANHCRCRISDVRRVRRGASLDQYGEPIIIVDDDVRVRIAKYVEQGIEMRQIARFTGQSATTIRRIINEAA